MTQPFTPRPYQLHAVDHIAAHKRCALFAEMGLGKTSATIKALYDLSLVEDIFPTLVIAPLRVAKTTWPDELAKWSCFSKIRVWPIIGNEKQRLFALAHNAEIYTINYENLEWLIEYYGERWPFKTVVADESTKLKGFRLRQGTKRARALARVAHTKTKRWINLSGTPTPNGLKDIWGQLWFIDSGQRLGRTFHSFSQRWFKPTRDGYGLEALPHAQVEIQERIKDVCLSLKAKDWFDLREPIVNKLYFDLKGKARIMYKEMEKEMFTQIEGDDLEAFNAATRTQKCLQIANGAAYVGEDSQRWIEVHNEKIKALESIIEEAAGAPVLVAYHFRSDLERLRKAFPSASVLDSNPKTIRNWNAGKLPILFAHPASAGHGLNLQNGGNILAFFSVNWNLEEHDQIIERIGPTRQMQAGHDRPVFIHYILARNTVDDMVMQRLIHKRSVQDVLMEAIKKRAA